MQDFVEGIYTIDELSRFIHLVLACCEYLKYSAACFDFSQTVGRLQEFSISVYLCTSDGEAPPHSASILYLASVEGYMYATNELSYS